LWHRFPLSPTRSRSGHRVGPDVGTAHTGSDPLMVRRNTVGRLPGLVRGTQPLRRDGDASGRFPANSALAPRSRFVGHSPRFRPDTRRFRTLPAGAVQTPPQQMPPSEMPGRTSPTHHCSGSDSCIRDPPAHTRWWSLRCPPRRSNTGRLHPGTVLLEAGLFSAVTITTRGQAGRISENMLPYSNACPRLIGQMAEGSQGKTPDVGLSCVRPDFPSGVRDTVTPARDTELTRCRISPGGAAAMRKTPVKSLARSHSRSCAVLPGVWYRGPARQVR